ncbi:MAG: hypothetical protein COB20_08700 [SAR86 cluster bacterium]|uniref:Sigma-54 factor interaction domain-containing protein n=1 Tax=SAR86 cluster bacterium TaxID=2030880 RepID=A0A2A4X4B4_9GAMM|nr:MAG: hypothetical protein COB20_08700 [SAR86 cluster bacterium]
MHLPALRERSADITLIANHFIDLYCRKYDKQKKKLSAAATDVLTHYKWPGNVRALRHAIERAVILATSIILEPADFQIGQDHFNQEVKYAASNPGESSVIGTTIGDERVLNLKQVEYRTIVLALKKHDYNISQTANELGLTRAALYRRMEKYGI